MQEVDILQDNPFQRAASGLAKRTVKHALPSVLPLEEDTTSSCWTTTCDKQPDENVFCPASLWMERAKVAAVVGAVAVVLLFVTILIAERMRQERVEIQERDQRVQQLVQLMHRVSEIEKPILGTNQFMQSMHDMTKVLGGFKVDDSRQLMPVLRDD